MNIRCIVMLCILLTLLGSCAKDSQVAVETVRDNSQCAQAMAAKPRSPLIFMIEKEAVAGAVVINVIVNYRYPAEIMRVTVVDDRQAVDLADAQLFTDLAAKQPVHARFTVSSPDKHVKISCFVKSAFGENVYTKTVRIQEALAPLRVTEAEESDFIYKQSGGQRLKLAPASSP